ncbi:MAG: glycosyltransferase [Sphingomonas sp.]|nr:glycosyltransferase [Sphingomonas sp.]
MRSEHVAIIVAGDLIGGHEMQLEHFAHAMARDQRVTLITLSPVVERFFVERGFAVRLAPFARPGKIWRQWLAAPALAAVLAPVIGDCTSFLVSGGTIEACVAPARALKLLRRDCSVSAYIPMYIDRAVTNGAIGMAYNWASLAFIGAIDRFVTINRVQARLIARHYGKPVRVVRNVITPVAPPVNDHGPRLIYVGRLEDLQKNVTGAIALLDHPDNPFTALHLYGSGPDEAAIEACARRARHLEVRLHGWVPRDRLSLELGRGDVLVMNSRFEGEPMIVRELAAAGIPAVVTDVPGFRGIVPRKRRYAGQAELLAILKRLYRERISPGETIEAGI